MSITDYIKETRAELKHVNWPTFRQTAIFTVVVIAISLLTAAYLGIFDGLFRSLLKDFII